MTALPPCAVTAAAVSAEWFAPAPRQLRALPPRRSTWTIIGVPAMSSNGLPGRRVEAMRAGISTKVRCLLIGTGLKKPSKLVGVAGIRRVYTGCQSTGKPISQAVSGCAAIARFRGFPRGRKTAHLDLPAWGLIRNGLLRTQQNPRCRARDLPRAADYEFCR